MNLDELILEGVPPLTHDDMVDAHVEALAILDGMFIASRVVGSAPIVGPENASDIDVLVLIHTPFGVTDRLIAAGYTRQTLGSLAGLKLESWRKDRTNILVTTYADYYTKFVRAFEVAKFLGVVDREKRVIIHRMVRDEMTASEAQSFEVKRS